MNQKNCRSCLHIDVNEMSDEMYCKLKDYEALSGHGLSVTVAVGQRKPTATNTSQRIARIRARQKDGKKENRNDSKGTKGRA